MLPLNPKEIKDKYPKAYEKLKEFTLEDADRATLPKNVFDLINGYQLADMTISTHRGLYEFFDAQEIYIGVVKNNDGFSWIIGDTCEGMDAFGVKDRVTAEKAAFEAAFKELEKQLKND